MLILLPMLLYAIAYGDITLLFITLIFRRHADGLRRRQRDYCFDARYATITLLYVDY